MTLTEIDNDAALALDTTEWRLISDLLRTLQPPHKLSTIEWAERYRYIAKTASAFAGKFNAMLTPYMLGVYALLDEPTVKMITAQKSAQIAWTETINNYLGKHIDIAPCNIIIMFAKEKAAKDYEREKLIPMIQSTPKLTPKVNVTRSKASGNTWDHKSFPGGFLKLVTSNSAASVKSTPASLLIVEEPDDANANVSGQGNTLKLLQERGKTFANAKMIFGGTPTIEGLSNVEAGYNAGDQRIFMVECHHCEQDHELNFEYLLCKEHEDGYHHPEYGKLDPSTAYYVCPHCGGTWNDEEKNRNIRHSIKNHYYGWKATQRFSGTASVRFNELLSPFPGSRFADLKKKELSAKHEQAKGNEEDWIVFVNNSMGIPYAYGTRHIDEALLQAKAQDYAEMTIPQGGLILSAGVDVQHDRLAIIIRAWGRAEQSWLVYWGEIYGTTSQITDPVWDELTRLLWTPIPFAANPNKGLIVSCVSIDSSDGSTNDAVYKWVNKNARRALAIKGASSIDAPIYKTATNKSRKNERRTKADTYGLNIHLVGTDKAKDLIIGSDANTGRIRLQGNQHGTMNWYSDVRPDYYEQLLSEVKAPHRNLKGRLVWQKKTGARNEALDCEVYALHAARHLKLHLFTENRWDQEEVKHRQTDLLDMMATPKDEPTPLPSPQPARKQAFKSVKATW